MRLLKVLILLESTVQYAGKQKRKVSLASKDGKTYGTLIEEQNYKTLTLVLVTLEVVEDALIRQDR